MMNKKIKKLVFNFAVCCAFFVVAFNFYREINSKPPASPFDLTAMKSSKEVILPGQTRPSPIDDKLLDSAVFNQKYENKLWGVGSGPGSYAANTVQYRELLQKMFDDDRYNSFVDFGCGDFQIMSLMKVPSHKSYSGIDVVADVIEKNKKLYGSQHPNYQFHHVEDLGALKRGSELLKGDMLIVKDVLIHFPNKNIQYFIDNILPNFKYALITNDHSLSTNADIAKGSFHAVDLASPPFNLKNLQVVLEYTNPDHLKRVYLYNNPNM